MSDIENANNVCLMPDCSRGMKVRGLCTHHYHSFLYHVQKGNLTWDMVVKAGLALPGRNQGKRSKIIDMIRERLGSEQMERLRPTKE